MKSKQSGFTLVEIAIVLVIVGLLLGGVLKGQELITSSRAKSLFNDRAALQSAFNTYQDRFKAMPGDDGAANTRFTAEACGGAGAAASAAACQPGDGNGVLTGNGVAGATAPNANIVFAAGPPNFFPAWEGFKSYWHLRAAQMIKLEGQGGAANNVAYWQAPTNATGGQFGVNSIQPFFGQPAAAVYFTTRAVPTNVAQALDSANDDGFVNRGEIRAANNGTAAAPNTVAGAPYGAGATFTVSFSLL